MGGIEGVTIRQRVNTKEVKARVHLNIPAWVYKELGFEPGDQADWVPIVDDKGEKIVALRRIPKEKVEGEEKEKVIGG